MDTVDKLMACSDDTLWSMVQSQARKASRCDDSDRRAEPSLAASAHCERSERRAKRERLARYVSRPPVSVERLDLTAQGQVRYRLKTPYRDGTTHIVLEPVDFIARLAALVPPPRVAAEQARMNWARRLKLLARPMLARLRDGESPARCATQRRGSWRSRQRRSSSA